MASRNSHDSPKGIISGMKIHTVFITHNRLHLTERAIESYQATISVPHSFIVVDNASQDGTREWLMKHLGPDGWRGFANNAYPGKACNWGWSLAPEDASFFHRADNDFAFLPGWCEEVERIFQAQKIGQVGLRTDEEEQFSRWNVGGNNVIRRELWDKGLRYDERPWTQYPPGYSEDSFFSPTIVEMGYTWTRVKKPCVVNLATGDWGDPYYQRSYGDRGITPHPDDPTVPGTR